MSWWTRRYGQHVTTEDIARHLSPPAEDVAAVAAWASAGGAGTVHVSVTGDYVFASTPAAALERLLGVQLHTYRHVKSGARLVRAATPMSRVPATLPSELAHVVDGVVGVADFPVDARRMGAERVPAPTSTDDSAIKVTPPVIWKAYGLEDAPTSFTSSQSSQSVAEFEQAYFYPQGAWNAAVMVLAWWRCPGHASHHYTHARPRARRARARADLNLFQKKFGLEVKNLTRIVGKNDPSTGTWPATACRAVGPSTVSPCVLRFDLARDTQATSGSAGACCRLRTVTWMLCPHTRVGACVCVRLQPRRRVHLGHWARHRHVDVEHGPVRPARLGTGGHVHLWRPAGALGQLGQP